MILFSLYLILVAHPNADDTNLLAINLSQQECTDSTGVFNGAYHAEHPDQQPPKYMWVCVEEQDPPVDDWHDLFERANAVKHRSLPRQPVREGFEFQGRWITPEEAHRECKAMMDRIDALPKEKRLYIYEHNELPKAKR